MRNTLGGRVFTVARKDWRTDIDSKQLRPTTHVYWQANRQANMVSNGIFPPWQKNLSKTYFKKNFEHFHQNSFHKFCPSDWRGWHSMQFQQICNEKFPCQVVQWSWSPAVLTCIVCEKYAFSRVRQQLYSSTGWINIVVVVVIPGFNCSGFMPRISIDCWQQMQVCILNYVVMLVFYQIYNMDNWFSVNILV